MRFNLDSRKACLAALVGALCSVRPVEGQLVVGNSPSSGAQISLIDLSGMNPPRLLVSGSRVDGLAADNASQVLYWTKQNTSRVLFKATFTPSGLLTPITVGPLAQQVKGLAWDSVDNQLIGSTSTGLWQISTTDASMTQQWAASQSLNGLDFDPATNAFYAVNSSATTLNGLGIYRIAKPLSSPTVTKIADFPKNGETSIPGLAVGYGMLYLVNERSDTVGQPAVYAYNLATNLYETGPSFSFTTNNSGSTASGGAWAPGLFTPTAGTDLVVSAGASQDCSLSVGGTLAYSVHAANYGTIASGAVILTVDLPPASTAIFASSNPSPTSATATQLTYLLSPISGFGATSFTDIKIFLTAVGAGATSAITATASTTSDINPTNNTALASSWIFPAPPSTSTIRGLISTNPALANSLVPGGGGAHFAAVNSVYSSPSGNWWALTAGTGATSPDNVTLRAATGGSPAVVLKYGATATSNGILNSVQRGVHVNDSGSLAFCGTDDGPAASKYFVAITDGSIVTDIARQGQAIPAVPTAVYGTTFGSLSVLTSGQAAFGSGNGDPGGIYALLKNDGLQAVALQNVTLPGGASAPLNELFITPENYAGFVMSAAGTHYAYQGRINTGLDTNDGVTVVDGSVLLQEGTTLPGMTSSVSDDIQTLNIDDAGGWLLAGYTIVGSNWVIRGSGSTITQLIQSGDPIYAGASETWQLIFLSNVISGPGGHFLISGKTSASDTFTNFVLVYDNTIVLARANDPVDLDGNGIFDDGVYIKQVLEAVLTNDNAVVAHVTLRDDSSALCHQNTNQVGEALVRIPIPTVTCCRGTTCLTVTAGTCTGVVAGSNSTVVGSCGPNGQFAHCCYGDYDHNGTSDVNDIFIYLNAWFSSSPYATVGGDGVVTPVVNDIFVFLNAWFGGCS